MQERGEQGRLLVVDDDDLVREIVRGTFDDSFEVHEASDGLEGLSKASSVQPQVILSDQRMPGMSGVDLLSALRQQVPGAVRILMTGHSDLGPLVKAINSACVHHYVEKPFSPILLKPIVIALYEAARLEVERDRLLGELAVAVGALTGAERELTPEHTRLTDAVQATTEKLLAASDRLTATRLRLQSLTIRDNLTGLFNRRALMEQLDIEIARSRRYDRVFSVLFLNVDDFDGINTQHGQAVGEDVLRVIAGILGDGPQGLRDSDYRARYGGEEFCVVMPETAVDGARVKAERLCRTVASHSWARECPVARVTVSIGVAAFPNSGDTSDKLIAAAAEAMRVARQSGSSQVGVAHG